MFYKIYDKDNLIYQGRELLSTLSWDNEIMYTPTLSLTFPITHLEYLHEFGHIKVYVNDKVFWGIIVGIDIHKDDETIDVDLNHIVHEWTFREISVNNAIKEKKINIIYQKEVEETVTTTTENKLAKALEWYENRKGKVTYSMTNRLGPNSYDCSSALYTALVYAGIFEQGKMGTTSTLAKDLTDNGWVETTSPQKGDVFLWTAGQGGYQYGHTGMFTRADRIIHCNAGANGISENKFTYTFAKIYHDPNHGGGTTTEVVKKMEEIDPEVVDQIDNIYGDHNFAYPGWNILFSEKASEEEIDYVYSRQNKLDALTKTCELTEDLAWRVRFVDEKVIDISEFGVEKPYIFSIKPSGKTNIRIITEPSIEYDFDDIINVASVYSAKSDSGMSSLTLREIYNDPYRQEDGFPVIILKPEVNNERDYSKYVEQPRAIAPNNELEFAVVDLEGVAEAGGYLVESSFAFNDISPFAVDKEDGKTTTITDKDRLLAARQAYKAAIRKLKAARAKYKIEIETEEMPADINVGDKVRLLYDNDVLILESCSSYMKKILEYDDYFYVSHINYDIDESGGEVDKITLTKELEVDREELNEK